MEARESRNIMVDFETLGTSEDSLILSAGLLIFDTNSVLGENYWEFDTRTQIYDGRTVDPRTVAWWKKTNPQELLRLLDYGEELLVTLTDTLRQDYPFKNTYVWSRGYMDFAILNSLLGANAYPYWAHRDVRTLDIFGMKKGESTHNALEDCRVQTRYVQSILQKFSEGQWVI